LGENLSVLQKRGDDPAPKLEYHLPGSIKAPVFAGQRIGVGEAIYGGKVLASAPLIAPAAVPLKPSLMQRLRAAL